MDARNTGALIAARRKALGLTQKQLAERLLISDKAVSKWEVGASYPEVTLLPALAAILGITVDELLAGEVRGEAQAASGTENAPAAAPDPSDALRQYGGTKKAFRSSAGWKRKAFCFCSNVLGGVLYSVKSFSPLNTAMASSTE